MKSYLKITIVLWLLISSCVFEKNNKSELIEFDVLASYPSKEMQLEEVAGIEYLQLEFDEDFLYNDPQVIISSSKIITFNRHNGDVLVFSRDGKPLSKFNRKGNGPGEYTLIGSVIYDETSDDLFMLYQKIMVYSSLGEFKRNMPLPSRSGLHKMANYDTQSLLLSMEANRDSMPPFSLISKQNGSIVDIIDVPANDKKVNIYAVFQNEGNVSIIPAPVQRMIKYNDGFLLTDFSTDTVYFLSSDKKLSPILVRKPNVQTMEPVVILNGFIEAGGFEFSKVVEVSYKDGKFPVTYLMRDQTTGSIYKQKITFNDYKETEISLSPDIIANTQDSRIGLIVLSLSELQKANSEHKISGKLKEMVEQSDEDGNDIFMLLHFK